MGEVGLVAEAAVTAAVAVVVALDDFFMVYKYQAIGIISPLSVSLLSLQRR